MAQQFAAFDIDGTIVRTGLFFQIVDELIAAEHLPADLRARLDIKLEDYRQRKHPEAFVEYQRAIVEAFFAKLDKVREADYRQAVDKVVRSTQNYTYVYTRELIKSLKAKDYFLIALSGSESYAIKSFMKPFGFDIVLGDVYVAEDGRFTGEVQSVIGEKGSALRKIAAEHNLTFTGSLAVGDTHRDSKMLEIVEHPIAFNPDNGLFDIAHARGWEIVVERKNVIYELEPKNGTYRLKA